LKNTLVVIPARSGSKRIPGKNIKLLAGKPLIDYSIQSALQVFSNKQICITTDDEKVIERAKANGLDVPFIRPASLATDESNMVDVLKHCVSFYEERNQLFHNILLLQPTSPFRKKSDITSALNSFTNDVDLVASVFVTKSNPYYLLYEEDAKGFLKKSKGEKFFGRAQDIPAVYELNGSVFIIRVETLKSLPCTSVLQFPRVKKYIMDEYYSVDLDTEIDWQFAEFLLNKKLISLYE
jgi:CMP-N,N'-diacetyllegionaminic acid synthase